MDNLTRAHHYRDEAINLRALAEKDDNPETRESLLSVARSYDRLYSKYLALGTPDAAVPQTQIKQDGGRQI